MNLIERKDIFGKIFFIISIFLFLLMLISPSNHVFIHIDEYFTMGLIKLPFLESIIIAINDVHPPFYYIILKCVLKFLTFFNIKYNTLLTLKIVSIVPYILLILISGTKIRKEFGWLSAGVFVFILGTLSQLPLYFLIIRMYSWALFFLVMSFLYFNDIINKNDLKSWLLFGLFSVLGAYTHYFVILSSVILYILLLCYFIFYNKNYNFNDNFSVLKKWIFSVLIVVILYLPWIPFLIKQISVKHHIPTTTMNLNTIFSFICISNINIEYFSGIKLFLLEIFSFLVLIGLILLFYKLYDKNTKQDNYIIMSGFLILFGTILLTIILYYVGRPMLVARYFIPAIAVFWLSISILIGKIKSNKIFALCLIILLILSIIGIVSTFHNVHNLYNKGEQDLEFINQLNNNDTIIICNSHTNYIFYSHMLNNANIYCFKFKYNSSLDKYGNIKEIHNESLKEVVKKHPNKKIYQFIGSKEYKNLSSYEKSKTHYGNIIIHRLN